MSKIHGIEFLEPLLDRNNINSQINLGIKVLKIVGSVCEKDNDKLKTIESLEDGIILHFEKIGTKKIVFHNKNIDFSFLGQELFDYIEPSSVKKYHQIMEVTRQKYRNNDLDCYSEILDFLAEIIINKFDINIWNFIFPFQSDYVGCQKEADLYLYKINHLKDIKIQQIHRFEDSLILDMNNNVMVKIVPTMRINKKKNMVCYLTFDFITPHIVKPVSKIYHYSYH
jgi:hypothetical protein